MKLLEINARSQELLTCLCQVWESSVRATHHFLSEEYIVQDGDIILFRFNV